MCRCFEEKKKQTYTLLAYGPTDFKPWEWKHIKKK